MLSLYITWNGHSPFNINQIKVDLHYMVKYHSGAFFEV